MLSFRLFSVEQKSRTVSAVQVSRRFASRTAHSQHAPRDDLLEFFASVVLGVISSR